MVEILAVVVILAVISTIGIVSITRMLDKSREQYYNSQNDSFIMAAKAYANDHREVLPKNIGGASKIELGKLIKSNYLKEQIKDQDKNPCDPILSYVKVFKKNKNDYRYVGYLNCPACNKNKKSDELKDGYCNTDSEEKPEASITLGIGTMTVQGKTEEQIKKAQGTLEMKGNSSGTKELYSYSYKVYRDGALAYNSSVKRVRGQTKTISINSVLAENVPGNLKVVLTVTNEDGFSKTVSKSKDYNDVVNPHCGDTSGEGKTKEVNGIRMCDDSAWIKTPRRVFIECRDYEGSGCKMLEFAKYFTDESKEYGRDTIDIEDVSNKKTTCTVYTCIDKTPPTMKVEVYKRLNDNNNIKDYEKETPLKTFEVSKNETVINDLGWFNASYPKGIFFIIRANDKILLKSYKSEYNDSNLYGSNGDANKFKNKSTTSTDSIYKLSVTKTAYLEAEGRRYVRFTVADGAGNITSISFKAEIDRTAPTLEIKYGRCGDRNDTNCNNYNINNPSTVTANNANKARTVNEKTWISKGMQFKYKITDKNQITRKWQWDKDYSMIAQGDATKTGHGESSVDGATSGSVALTGTGQRQGIMTATDAAGNSVNVKVNVWVANLCKITYSPNGGTFHNHASDLVEKVDYDNYVGDSGTGLRNATGKDTYYQGTRDYYHTESTKQWISGTTVFNEKTRYKVQNMCSGMTDGEDKEITLLTNWKGNTCTINYDPNGGSFTNNANALTETKTYPEVFGTVNNGMRNATGTNSYYKGTRDYYHLDNTKQWIQGSTTIDETSPHTYTTVQICGSDLKTKNVTTTLKANWQQNTCTIVYHANKNGTETGASFNSSHTIQNYTDKKGVTYPDSDYQVLHKGDSLGGTSENGMRDCQGGYYNAKWADHVIDINPDGNKGAQWRRFRDGTAYNLDEKENYPVEHDAICPDLKTKPDTPVHLYVKWKSQKPTFVIHYWRHTSSKDDCNSKKSSSGTMKQQYPYRAYNYYQFFCECHYKESDSSLNTAEPYLKRHSTHDHVSLDGKRTVKCGESKTWYYKESTPDEQDVCFAPTSYIYYRKDKDKNGLAACNHKDGDSIQINQYVYRVCTDGKVYNNHGSGKTGFIFFHGAHWYWGSKATAKEKDEDGKIKTNQKDYYYPHTGSYFLFNKQSINEDKGTSIMVEKEELANDEPSEIYKKYDYTKDKKNKMHKACVDYCTNIYGNPRHSYNDKEDDINDYELEDRDDED